MTVGRFTGSLLGLALGDALGAAPDSMRWTDDTQMSLDVAESLIEHGAILPDDLAKRFAQSYEESRGYGPGAARLLRRIADGEDWRVANRSVFADGSFGNGAAMRAPVVGLFFAGDPGVVRAAAEDSARVTHAHPLGMEGAVLVALATARASSSRTGILRAVATGCERREFRERLDAAPSRLDAGEVARRLGNGVAALDSCVTAIFVAVRFLDRSFEEMIAFVAAVGGDTDTIGAMAGAIWGAANGEEPLPAAPLARLEQHERLRATAQALHQRGMPASR